MIKKTFDNNKTFSFDLVSFETIFKKITSLDTNKAAHSNDVPTKIVKAKTDLFSIFVSNTFNESVISCKFLSVLKLAVTPVHKKSRLEKSNYRPVSLLPKISKIFTRCMYRQMSEYFETVFSKFQCGFRKGYSDQDCLLSIDLIVAKLHTYGFSIESLKLINSYLTERTQKVKINDQFSSWFDIIVYHMVVPQRFIFP